MTETIAAPPKPRRKAPLILAGALVLALLAGAGWLVLSMLRGATPAAAKGLPNNAVAVVEINLNPSAESKLAAKEFVEKFPILTDHFKDVGTDYKAALYNLLSGTDVPDYSEVSAWLGDSMAVGVVPDPTEPAGPNNVLPVVSFQITDKDKARAFAEEHMPDQEPIIVNDLMVLAPTELSLTADSLGDNSIASLSEYSSDLSKLGTDYLATAWISEKFTETTMSQQIPATFPKARAAMGLAIKDGTLSVRSIGTTVEGVTVDGNIGDVAADLPASAAVAGAVKIPKEFADHLWSFVESTGENPMSSVGVSSVEDLRTLVGTEIAFTLEVGESPTAALAVRSDDPAKHQQLLSSLLKDAGTIPTASVIEGDRVITTFETTAESFTAPSEKLGDNSTYQQLTAGIDNPQSILWVDGSKLQDLVNNLSNDADLAENLRPITGIGVVSKQLDANTAEGWLRISTS